MILMAQFECNVSFGSLSEMLNKNTDMNQNDANNSKQQQQQQQQQQIDKKSGKKVKPNIANVNDLVETCLHKTQKITVSKAFVKLNNKPSITQSDNTNCIDNASVKDLSKLKSGDTLQICFLSNGLHVAVKLSDINYIESAPSKYIFKGILQLNNINYHINGNIDDKTANGEAELSEYLEQDQHLIAKPTTSSSSLSSASQIDSTTNTFQANLCIKSEPIVHTGEIPAPFLSSSQESLNEEPSTSAISNIASTSNTHNTDNSSNKCWNKKRYLIDKYNQTNNDNST